MSTSQIAMNDGMSHGSTISAVQHKRNSISPSDLIDENNPLKTLASFHERPVSNSYFSPVSQQSAQSVCPITTNISSQNKL
jgi:hypothetical protein